MRTIGSNLQTMLDSKYTTLAWCWKLTRSDGIVLGFTDHDKDLSFDGVTFEANSGFTASEMDEAVGLSVDNLEAEGALSSDKITELDIAEGFYDNAAIEVYRVDWTDTANRLLMRKGNLGEITVKDIAFVAEIRGLAHILNQPQGRVFQAQCDADLGDTRCGIDLTDPAYNGAGSVASVVSTNSFTVDGLESFADELFSYGILTWSSGSANEGHSVEVKQHVTIGGSVQISLWLSPLFAIQPNDTFTIKAGCDKLFATCIAKFNNKDNFRGFPHIPGTDYVISYAIRDDPTQDGGKII